METVEFFAIIWSEYFDGKISINKVLQAYDDYEFDANQDIPGNACWEELYHDFNVIGSTRDFLY